MTSWCFFLCFSFFHYLNGLRTFFIWLTLLCGSGLTVWLPPPGSLSNYLSTGDNVKLLIKSLLHCTEEERLHSIHSVVSLLWCLAHGMGLIKVYRNKNQKHLPSVNASFSTYLTNIYRIIARMGKRRLLRRTRRCGNILFQVK